MNNTELQYDQHLPPAHDLQIHNLSNLQLLQLTSRKLSSDILSLKYDREGEYLALGCKNGTKILYSVPEKKFTVKADDIKDNSITSMRWRPTSEGKSKILVTADAGGYIIFYHVPTLKPLFSVVQSQNSVHSIDFSFTARHFATGGKDSHVRFYDEETKTVSVDFKPAGWNNVGHDNRVFAVKFIDENIIMSGGWDSVVHIWDVRQGKSTRHFYGPNISGESLDYDNGMILAGCYAANKQLQVWDLKTLHKVEQIDWTDGDIDDAQYIYAASYSKRDPTIFGAGTTGPNSEVRIYKETIENPHIHKIAAKIKGLNQGCFSLDFSSKFDQFAFSTPHHGFYIYDYNTKH